MNGIVPAWAAEFVGLPYEAGGRTREGLDCWGLVLLVWRDVYGIELPTYDGPFWQKGADVREIGAAVDAQMAVYSPVQPGDEREGDGILLRMRGVPLHVGLVLFPGVMLHTHEGADVCVERYDSLAWNKRILGFYRHERANRP